MYSEPHLSYMHEFLNLTCTHRFVDSDWCVIDDHLVALWYNTANRTNNDYELHWEKPSQFLLEPLQALNTHPLVLNPTNGRGVLSKFVYQNEVSGEEFEEYIEPLVSHLRWPLSHCYDDPSVDK